MTNDFDLVETKYGFRWGPATVFRLFSDPRSGVIICIASEHGGEVQVSVSPKGRSIRSSRSNQGLWGLVCNAGE